MTKGEYLSMIGDKAAEAAARTVEDLRARSVNERDWEQDLRTYTDQYADKLMAAFPFTMFRDNQAKQEQFRKWNGKEGAWRWLQYGDTDVQNQQKAAYDPFAMHEQAEYASLRPLLNGSSKRGESWTDLPVEVLKSKAYDMGYDVSTPEAFGKFLADVSKYQIKQDRAGILRETREDPAMFATSLVYPTMYEEAERQIATGSGDENDVLKAGALDTGVNLAMFGAPGLRGFRAPESGVARAYNTVTNGLNKANVPMSLAEKSPILSGFVGAGEQAALEGGRQYGKLGIDSELDPSLMMILGAGTAGATRPAAIGAAQGYSNALGTSKQMKDFSRGVGSSMRFNDPVAIERQGIVDAWGPYVEARQVAQRADEAIGQATENPAIASKLAGAMQTDETGRIVGVDAGRFAEAYREAAKEAAQASADAAAEVIGERRTMADIARRRESSRAMDSYLTALGLGEADIEANKKGLAKILDVYDTQMGNKKFPATDTYGDWLGTRPDDIYSTMDRETYDAFRETFPAKFEELKGDNGYFRAGRVAGETVGDLGGRIEPTFKVTPSDVTKQELGDYKQSAWYQKMTPEERKIVDDKMNEKASETSLQLFGIGE